MKLPFLDEDRYWPWQCLFDRKCHKVSFQYNKYEFSFLNFLSVSENLIRKFQNIDVNTFIFSVQTPRMPGILSWQLGEIFAIKCGVKVEYQNKIFTYTEREQCVISLYLDVGC